jgi:hypothetical protein
MYGIPFSFRDLSIENIQLGLLSRSEIKEGIYLDLSRVFALRCLEIIWNKGSIFIY